MQCNKVRYSTYESAVAAAVRCVEHMSKVTPEMMQPYPCSKCRGWHLTSKPWRSWLSRFPAVRADG